MKQPLSPCYPDVILLGQGNYNTLGVLHQLAQIGVSPLILSIGKAREISRGNIIGYSKYAVRIVEVNSESQAVAWIKNNRERFPVGTIIYPTSDKAEMELDCAYADLIHHFRFPNAGAQGRVSELMDKHYQMDLAKKFGLRVLESEYTNAVDFSLERVKYPCLIKPLNSTTGSKGDMHVCSRLEELKSALSTATETQDFIVQQYIRNEGDILCLGMSFANGDVWLPAVVFKPGVSAVGEYTHAVVSTDVRKYLPEYEAVQRFVKATKYVGPFSVEFGLEQGKNYFFEINLRNDGTSHYPLKAHVNLIQSYIEETHVRTLPIVEYNMVDEVGDLRRVLLHELSLYQWWKNFCAAGSYRFYSDKDWTLILPLMSMFLKRSFSKLTNSRR